MRDGRQDKPEQRLYGILLRVADLPSCRAFYQEVLGLGLPVVDSNYWVEFEPLPGGLVLTLQHDPAAPGRAGRGNTAWCLVTPQVATLAKRLEEFQAHPVRSDRLPSGALALTFQDPEGNAFVLMEPASA